MSGSLKPRRVAVTFLAAVLALGITVRTQSSGLTITLAGQSMIRSDLRVTAADAVPAIAALLQGDVKFTNFEAVVTEPGQPNTATPETRPNGGWLTPPDALGSLQALGFNIVSLANNHAWDLKVPGIQNTLGEATKLSLTHAGIGTSLAEATAPGYLKTPKGTVAL